MTENTGLRFRISDMTCNHCVGAITGAITKAIPGAHVKADLAQHTVTITGTADKTRLARIIEEEGYTPEAI